jgi:hypothetical protein
MDEHKKYIKDKITEMIKECSDLELLYLIYSLLGE